MTLVFPVSHLYSIHYTPVALNAKNGCQSRFLELDFQRRMLLKQNTLDAIFETLKMIMIEE